jgi:hypothetical protein
VHSPCASQQLVTASAPTSLPTGVELNAAGSEAIRLFSNNPAISANLLHTQGRALFYPIHTAHTAPYPGHPPLLCAQSQPHGGTRPPGLHRSSHAAPTTAHAQMGYPHQNKGAVQRRAHQRPGACMDTATRGMHGYSDQGHAWMSACMHACLYEQAMHMGAGVGDPDRCRCQCVGVEGCAPPSLCVRTSYSTSVCMTLGMLTRAASCCAMVDLPAHQCDGMGKCCAVK